MSAFDFAASRERWRAHAIELDTSMRAVCDPKSSLVVVEDDAGDLLIVRYGVHGYPVSIERLEQQAWERFRSMAVRVVGDVRMSRRPC